MLATAPLSLTSQFGFCGIPLRLDSFAGCGFQCTFCFARYRGGNSHGGTLRPADGESLNRLFRSTFQSRRSRPGILAQFLQQKVPIHFGGMSDPLQAAELRFRVTESFLRTLARFKYPVVLSTRSHLAAREPYISLLREIGNVVVQFSFCSSRDSISARFEPHSPPPTELLKTMCTLSRHGITVTARWQPYIPGVSEPVEEFVARISTTGCRHVALEHLKIPVEQHHVLWRNFTDTAQSDFHQQYRSMHATRDGREFVLPASAKIGTIVRAAKTIRASGMTFGAADNEFQFLSDTGCCCSGIDRFPGFENWFKHQVGYAVRKCLGKRITYDSISQEWAPHGSIDRYLNSRSRLSRRSPLPGSLSDHIRSRWNDLRAPGNPVAFYGVVPTSEATRAGNRIYTWNDEQLADLDEIIAARTNPARMRVTANSKQQLTRS
jgi:DNA repair photolyase